MPREGSLAWRRENIYAGISAAQEALSRRKRRRERNHCYAQRPREMSISVRSPSASVSRHGPAAKRMAALLACRRPEAQMLLGGERLSSGLCISRACAALAASAQRAVNAFSASEMSSLSRRVGDKKVMAGACLPWRRNAPKSAINAFA